MTLGGCVKDGRVVVPVLLHSSVLSLPDDSVYRGSFPLMVQARSTWCTQGVQTLLNLVQCGSRSCCWLQHSTAALS